MPPLHEDSKHVKSIREELINLFTNKDNKKVKAKGQKHHKMVETKRIAATLLEETTKLFIE